MLIFVQNYLAALPTKATTKNAKTNSRTNKKGEVVMSQ